MITETKLKNGVVLIGERVPHARSISIGVWTGAGSVNESGSQSGIAHFIEHMMFKGTGTRTALDIASEVDFYGGQLNAFTAKECTQYSIKCTDDKLEKSMEILGDIVNNPALPADELEREKGVVLEEIAMVEDTPDDIVIDELVAAFFDGSPLGKPILGNADAIKGYVRDDLYAFINRYYVDKNIVIAIAGNYDEQQFVDCAGRYFGSLRSGEAALRVPAPAPSKKRVVTREKSIEQMNIALALPGYDNDSDRYVPRAILNNALGGSMSSRMFQSIREQRGLAYAVYSFSSSYVNTGFMAFYAATGNAQGREVLRLMLEELEKVKKEGLTDEEFQRNKNQLRASFIMGMESVSARMNGIGKARVLRGKVRTEDEVLARIDAATQDDVRAVLDELFDFDRLCAAFVGDVGKLGDVSSMW